MRRLLFWLVAFSVILVAILLGCEAWIGLAAKGRVFDNAESIPPRDTALVLGTSRRLRGGGDNPYFQARMDAAARLYRLGKVKRFLLSGDHRERFYNEPGDMKRALLERHVPAQVLMTDFAGVRTFDSVVRAHQTFGLNHFTIVSQRDQDQRALLIAAHYHIDAIAYAAEDVPFNAAPRSHIREWLAQAKAILDLYVLHTHPRRLGPAPAPHTPKTTLPAPSASAGSGP